MVHLFLCVICKLFLVLKLYCVADKNYILNVVSSFFLNSEKHNEYQFFKNINYTPNDHCLHLFITFVNLFFPKSVLLKHHSLKYH